jgi:hypothetical protein
LWLKVEEDGFDLIGCCCAGYAGQAEFFDDRGELQAGLEAGFVIVAEHGDPGRTILLIPTKWSDCFD